MSESTEINTYDLIDLNEHGFIQASAGTGKTYTIQHLVNRILCNPNQTIGIKPIDIEELLIVTYTDKAAGELKTKIRKTLEETISKLKEKPSDNVEFKFEEKNKLIKRLEDNLSRSHQASIQTIHGFCRKQLSSYAFESKTNFNLNLIDDSQEIHKELRRLLENSWNSDNSDSGIPDFEKHLREFLETKDGRSTFEESIFKPTNDYSLDDELLPEILGGPKEFLASYDKIFTQLNENLNDFVNNNIKDLYNNCEALLNEIKQYKIKGVTKGVNALKKIVGEIDEYFTNKDIQRIISFHLPSSKNNETDIEFSNERINDPLIASINSKLPKDIVDLFTQLKHHADAIKVHRNTKKIAFRQLCVFLLKKAWIDRKKKFGLLAFDDMIRLVSENLSQPHSPLLQQLKHQYRYGIIDEFQDTNTKQWNIFRRIFLDADNNNQNIEANQTASNIANDNAKNNNTKNNIIYVVGDPKQSIYKFQAADVKTYLEAVAKIAKVGKEIPPLNKNYRSTPEMIDAYNLVFTQEINQGDKIDDWFSSKDTNITYKDKEIVETGKTRLELQEHLKSPIIFNNVITESESDSAAPKLREYANWCFEQIKILLNTPLQIPERIGEEKMRDIKPNDIALLVQQRSLVAPLLKLLRKKNIPYSLYKEAGVFQSDEALHLITLLEAIVDFDYDLRNIKKSLLGIFFNLAADDVENFNSDNDKSNYIEFFLEWQEYAEQRRWAYLIKKIFQSTNIKAKLLAFADGDQRLSNLEQVSNYLLEQLITKNLSLEDATLHLRAIYTEEINIGDDANIYRLESEESRIQVLTMHASKGLEFPICFLFTKASAPRQSSRPYYKILGDNGVSQLNFDQNDDAAKELSYAQDNQEVRRLLYVAMTRPTSLLFAPIWHKNKKDKDSGAISTTPSEAFPSNFFHAALNSPENSSKLISDKLEVAVPEETTNLDQNSNTETTLFEFGKMLESDDKLTSSNEALKNKLKQIDIPKRSRVQSSYSSIVHSQSHSSDSHTNSQSAEDIEAHTQHQTEIYSEQSTNTPPKETFLPKGANTGNALHESLEDIDFKLAANADSAEDLYNNPDVIGIITSKLRSNGLNSTNQDLMNKRIKESCEIIFNTLRTTLTIEGNTPFRLCDLDDENHLAEAEYFFNFDRDGVPFPIDKNSSENSNKSNAGYITGFIDLLFRIPLEEGSKEFKYFILDWKSNYLDNYSFENIDKSMKDSGYDIQADLYELAVHRWLKNHIANYNSNIHFGGCIYTYLRGVNKEENNSTGFWIRKGKDIAQLKDFISDKIKSTPNIKRVLENKEDEYENR